MREANPGIGDIVRQGDVFLLKIGDADQPVPQDAEILEDGILARGEATGHTHSVAVLESMLTEEDLLFLEEVQKKICAPIVFKDKTTGIARRSNGGGVPLEQHQIAKIHAPTPFIFSHMEAGVGIVPTEKEAQVRDLHSAFLMPAGRYLVIRQVEHDEAEQMRRVVD